MRWSAANRVPPGKPRTRADDLPQPIGAQPKWAGQPLWPGGPVGSSFGLYPAIEITLRLDRVCAAQPSSHAALGYAFRSLYPGHQPAPQTVPVQFGPGAESGRQGRWRLVRQTFSSSRPRSAMDTPIFEELQNTGNAELKPDRHDRAAALPRPAPIRQEVATTDTRASDTLPRLSSSDDQADIHAAFSAMTAGDGAHSAPRLSDENPGHGRLTVTGADAATIEQFTRLRPRRPGRDRRDRRC